MSAERADLDTDLIIKEYLSGKSIAAIAKELNCSYTAVRNRLVKNNIQRRSVEQINIERAKKAKKEKAQQAVNEKKYSGRLSIKKGRHLSFFD